MSATHSGASIQVRGARVHNLRDIDVDIPHGKLVVLTGVSGSGKSSLAFDTIHAEGQRRFLETLPNFARQLVEQLQPPDVDAIDGLPPTVAVDQKTGAANPRSTVATITEAHDYLRLLYARAGEPHCPQCGQAIQSQTAEQMVDSVMKLAEGSRLLLLAPLVKRRKGEHADAFATIRRAGLIRARIDGEITDALDPPPKLAKSKPHSIDAVVDRLVIRPGIAPRLAESVDRALKLGQGTVIIAVANDDGTWSDRILSASLACPDCGISLDRLEPGSFSFNSPLGACGDCGGLGYTEAFDPELIITDPALSLADGAIASLAPGGARALLDDPRVGEFLRSHRVTTTSRLNRWPIRVRSELVSGATGNGGFPGLAALLDETFPELSRARQAALAPYRATRMCEACRGTRLRPESRAVTIGGSTLPSLSAMTVTDAVAYLRQIAFPPATQPIGAPLVAQIANRLQFLNDVGLGYLTLDRPSDTLSGGELQRVRLASQLGSGLVGAAYVLDEPTTGLHPDDTERLLDTLRSLRDIGNTVVVVEHDEAVIRASDWLIDLGPGAGPDGGRVVATGLPTSLNGTESLTAQWLSGVVAELPSCADRLANSSGFVAVEGASEHNLRSIDARFPLGCVTCVTGVSGSGKSTLVQDVLARAIHRAIYNSGHAPGAHKAITGLQRIDKLVAVDQSPIGRTPRSTPATYTGLFDEIRKVFAATRDAKLRGFKSSRFSFNAKTGRCEVCQGQGFRRLEMQYLAEVFVPCPACDGKRFNPSTLDVRYKGRSIADVLDMRVDEALIFFDAIPRVQSGLRALHEAGLGYVTLGQSNTTLSGGEAQRIKLAAELGRPATGQTLYVLDEPTSGLHAVDVRALWGVLQKLVDLGNTVVLIEHNVDVIRASDWIIDLGPEGGPAGGRLLAMGPPAQVARSKRSKTAKYLRPASFSSE